MRSTCRASLRMREQVTVRGAYLVWAGIKAGRLRGRVGGGGCIVVAEFCMEGLHLLHADIVGHAQF